MLILFIPGILNWNADGAELRNPNGFVPGDWPPNPDVGSAAGTVINAFPLTSEPFVVADAVVTSVELLSRLLKPGLCGGDGSDASLTLLYEPPARLRPARPPDPELVVERPTLRAAELAFMPPLSRLCCDEADRESL